MNLREEVEVTKIETFPAGQIVVTKQETIYKGCLLYTSPSPRDGQLSRMPSSA